MDDTATDPLASVGVPGPADTQPSQPIDPMYPLAPSQGASPLAGGGYTPPQTPVQEDPAAQFGGLIPSEAMPRNPDIEREYHESTWHRILDRVGTILGGGESIHYTKDADGNVSITHTPSTTGEKWGRVAAAALGGAAKGLAASQGPGGLAKAGSAGVEYGLNIPKQMQENADAQATAEQKRMAANASHAMTQQDMFQKMLISQQLKTKVDQQSTDLLNAYRDGLQSSPDAKDFGVISSLDDLQKVHSANQDFLDKHTNLELKAALVPKAGGGTEIHAIATDPGDDARPVGKGAQLFKIEVDPKTHLPTLTSEEASPTTKKGTLRSYNQTVSAQYLDLANKAEDAQTRRDKVDKGPTGTEADRFTTQYLKDNNLPDNAANRLKARRAWSDAGEKPQVLPIAYAPNDQGGFTPQRVQPGVALPAGTVTSGGLNQQAKEGSPFKKPPAAIGSYDLAFPPVPNFEEGTPGIVPKEIGKVPAKVTNNADLSRNILENSTAAAKIIARRPDLFGALQGRFTTVAEMLGSDDEDMRNLAQRFSNIAKATVGIHGSRSKDLVHDEEKKLFNGFLAGPNGIRGAMKANVDSARTFLNTERNFQTYGSSTGPDRALDVNRRPLPNGGGGDAAPFVVTDPNGKPHPFNTKAEADAFKRAARIP